ncbi:MAG: outer membrane lipid asymmetry maintenance protein MlaD [Ponticaulis sp.]|nr:outer membrane lipid asymmetry maintenance protein MlaD [Ponticaulis sp.]|tara:strand:- start:31209 stop:31673 length:465 start_codon:yes stop_codon:yes gene_type:complete
MRNSVFETVLGAVVVAAAGLFLVFALSSTGSSGSGDSYQIYARFNNAVGIEPGSDVRMAGVKVGRVLSMEFDAETAEAGLKMTMRNDIELPEDSDAKIVSDGLLGGAFVAVEMGGSLDTLATDGSAEIQYTRGNVDIITLFANAVGGLSDSGED